MRAGAQSHAAVSCNVKNIWKQRGMQFFPDARTALAAQGVWGGKVTSLWIRSLASADDQCGTPPGPDFSMAWTPDVDDRDPSRPTHACAVPYTQKLTDKTGMHHRVQLGYNGFHSRMRVRGRAREAAQASWGPRPRPFAVIWRPGSRHPAHTEMSSHKDLRQDSPSLC